MTTIFADYKRQNTKGFKGIIKIAREQLTIVKWKFQYTYLKYIKYKLVRYTTIILLVSLLASCTTSKGLHGDCKHKNRFDWKHYNQF